jgi:4-amino-4-deoxy-L-arabinose transferase-like glycosyltransferase
MLLLKRFMFSRKNIFRYMIKYFDISSYLGKIFNLKSNKLLLIILLLSLIVRLLPIFWGVPISPYVKNYHPDEPKVYKSILNFPGIYFSTQTFMGYGTFIQYILGLMFLPLKLMFKILGHQENYGIVVIVLSRFSNVVMGTISVWFTYYLASKIFDRKVAILSALLLSLSLYHTINSSVITLDVAMGLLLIINFILSFNAIIKNNISSYILLGAASGMLLGIKLTGGLFFVIPVILILFNLKNIPADLSKKNYMFQQFKNVGAYVLVAIIIFLIFNPHVYLNPEKFINFYLRERRDWVDRTSLSISDTLIKFIISTSTSVGFPITILAFIGILSLRKGNLYLQLVLVFFLLEYYLFWRWFILPRYIISVTPIICIFAAHILVFFYKKNNQVIKGITVGILILTVGYSVYLSFSGIILRIEDTRPDASRYIDQNIKEGSTLGIGYASDKYSWKSHDWRYPKINFGKYKEENFLNGPDILILSSFDFIPIMETLNSNKIDSNFVLSKAYYKEWYRYSPPSSEILQFYHKLFNPKISNYILIKSFKKNINVNIEFPPPEIRIYKKR